MAPKKWPGRSQTPEAIAKRQSWIQQVRAKSADHEARTGQPFHSAKQKERFAQFMQATSKSGEKYAMPHPWKGETHALPSQSSSSTTVWNTSSPPRPSAAPPIRPHAALPLRPKLTPRPPATLPPAHLWPADVLNRRVALAIKAMAPPPVAEIAQPTVEDSVTEASLQEIDDADALVELESMVQLNVEERMLEAVALVKSTLPRDEDIDEASLVNDFVRLRCLNNIKSSPKTISEGWPLESCDAAKLAFRSKLQGVSDFSRCTWRRPGFSTARIDSSFAGRGGFFACGFSQSY